MTRRWCGRCPDPFLVAAVAVASVWLVVCSVQLGDVRGQRDRLRGDEATIARRCTFRPDGSATCAPGTFSLDGGFKR